MMRIRLIFTFIMCWTAIFYSYGQDDCTSPNPEPGLFCDPDVPDGAPILCELSCLDGYTARMPATDSTLLEWQPERLCETGQQGEPNNLSWFAFVAGSETIRMRIIPTNCTVAGNNQSGVQAGIYTKCDDWESLYCIGDCQDSDFVIGGPGFIQGETYYFFIDGCNGSVCDYEVELLEGEQAYPLPEIDSIIVNSTSSTICRGETVTLELTGLVQDSIRYDYTIDPPTIDYPSGTHPENSMPTSEWTFSEVGTFTICAQGDNGCDVTPRYCRQVTVTSIADEVFTPVELCMEDLATYRGPMTEDPNGDDTIGWRGRMFFTPGLNKDTITLPNGCWYTQEIEVNILSNTSRQDVTLYRCESDFPFLYEGTLIDQPVENFSVSLDDASANGCDSLVSLTVRSLSIDGEVLLNGCEGGQGLLNFVVTDFPLENEATFTLEWRDPSGNMVTPHNGDEATILVTQSGMYEAIVTLELDTLICSYSFFSENIDIDNLRPGLPNPIDWTTDICDNNQTNIYKVVLPSDDSELTWSYPSDVVSADAAGDSIVISWGNSAGGPLCVNIVNSCGTSSQYCHNIQRATPPTADLIAPHLVCLDDTIVIEFDGDFGLTYDWQLPGSRVVGSPDLTGAGPFTLVIEGDDGSRTLTYTVDDGVCASDTFQQDIEVFAPLSPPQVLCFASDNSVLFTWDDVPNAIDYRITVLTGNSGVVSGNSYLVENLERDDQVTIAIQSLAPLTCANSVTIEVSCIAGCDPLNLNLEVTDSIFCEGSNSVDLEVSGDIDMGTIQYLGAGVNPDGVFISDGLSPGNYPVIAQLTVDNCIYQDSITMEILPYPDYSLQVEDAFCPEDQVGMLSVSPAPSEGPNQYFLGDEMINEETIALPAGEYQLTIDNGNGCPVTEEIVILPIDQPSVELEEAYQVDEGIETTIPLLLEGFDTTQIINVDWYNSNGENYCTGSYEDCGTINLTASEDFTLCADITYGENCIVTRCASIDAVRVVNLYSPTIFSPNEDGINDTFTITANYPDVTISKFVMFDRWGEVVYAVDNVPAESESVAWDGNHKGSKAMPGVYVYLIQYIEDNVTYTMTGDVTLIR